MKLLWGALVAVVVAILLAGCGEGGDTKATAGDGETQEKRSQGPREAWITLDGYMGPENVGILMAEDRGYFDDVGIDVTVTHPDTPNHSLQYVVNRTVQFGVSHELQVALAQEKGAPIVAVASLIPRPTAAMIWLKKSGIDGIADLKGKTIAYPGLPFQEDLLENILERAALTLDDVEVKGVGYKLIPALVGGRADAIFGGSWNVEGARLEARGLKPVITRAQDLGIPTYDELVLIARTDLASKDPQLVRDVVSALTRGTAAAVEDPKGALRVVEEALEADPEAGKRATEAEVKATLPLLSTNPGSILDEIDGGAPTSSD